MRGKIEKVGNFSLTGHHGKNVYSIEGLCPTLCSGSIVKNGLNILVEREISAMDKETIENNFTKVGNNKYVTTDKGKENCYAVTTRPRSMGLSKKQDNYVLECIGSTQKHAARTDGAESPTSTEAMGKGGGHVPMLKLRESTSKGYKEAKPGDGVELSRSHCSVRRGVSHEDATGALNCKEGGWGAVEKDYRITKLTPTECERLQGFPDGWTEFGKDGEKISDTQRYKCCGNAVTTTVITHLINEMFENVE